MGSGTVVSNGEWSDEGSAGGGGRLRGFGLMLVPAVAVLAYYVYYLLVTDAGGLRRVLAWVAPAVMAGVVAYAVLWVDVSAERHDESSRVGAWFAAGVVAFGATAGLLVLLQGRIGGQVVAPRFSVATAAAGGGVLGTLVGIYDAAGRVRAERARAERAETRELNRRLSVLNRVLRHHLRNDLNLVEGNARILLDTGTPDPDRAREIREVSGELLELSERARAVETALGVGTDRRSPVDVAALARSHVERSREEHPEVLFEASLPESTEALAHELLDDAVGEAIDNAAEHNRGPLQRVAVEVRTDDDAVEVVVSDNGPVIPDDELDLVGSASEIRTLQSHGLGLWVIAAAVYASGGELRVEEADPSGSVVRIRLDRSG